MSITGDSPASREFVRLCNPLERFYHICQSHDFLVTAYHLNLISRKHLKQEDVHQALRHLFRKVPPLNLCIKGDGNEMGFYKMEKELLDFEVVNGVTDMSCVLYNVTHKGFSSTAEEGPLWRCKLLTNENTANDCYRNVIIFGFHHSIVDGFTCFRICNFFLKFLNDVIGNVAIDDKSVSEFCNSAETDLLINQRRKTFERHPELHEKVKNDMEILSNLKTSIPELYPSAGEENMTKHLTRNLNEIDTDKLKSKFKIKKVSFHSGFCAIAHWALVNLINDFFRIDKIDPNIPIGAYHAINMRRYWDNTASDGMGCHVGSIRTLMNSPLTLAESSGGLWNLAANYQQRIHTYLRNHRCFDEALEFKIKSKSGSTDMIDMFNDPQPPQFSFSATNMGNVDYLFNGEGDHVEVDWLSRSTSIYKFNVTMVHVLDTFRGRFLYGMDYVTRYVSEELAEKYADKIFEKIYEIINT